MQFIGRIILLGTVAVGTFAHHNTYGSNMDGSIMDDLVTHGNAMDNFHYTAEPEGKDDWRRLDINEPFYGDCEDFAFSLQHVMGGTVHYVFKEHNIDLPHAVLIKDGLVFDMDYQVMTVEAYAKKNTILKGFKMVFGEGYVRD